MRNRIEADLALKGKELRFRENGPAIPDELLVARNAGQVLFLRRRSVDREGEAARLSWTGRQSAQPAEGAGSWLGVHQSELGSAASNRRSKFVVTSRGFTIRIAMQRARNS